MDTLEALDRAVTSTAGIVKGLTPDHEHAATPCTEWDVHDVLEHLVGSLWLAEAILVDRKPSVEMAPGGLPATDVLPDGRAAGFETASAAALASARADGALTNVHDGPIGSMPGELFAGFIALDTYVHGWDVAKATGQPTDLDLELAEHFLSFAQAAIPDAFRPSPIGMRVEVADSAPAVDRLVAFLGRQP